MSDASNTQDATVEVEAHGAHAAAPNVIDVSVPMVALTWLTFALLLVVLYKVAWKPILKVLDMREKGIRDALASAEKARAEAALAEARNRELLQAAEQESRKLVAEARVAAQETGRLVCEQAEQRAQALVEEARRDIASAVEQARTQLRRETADLAIEVAGKVLAANMDTERNRALVRDLAKEMERT